MYWYKALYKVNLDEEELRSKLEKLISIQEPNTFRSHFSSKISGDDLIRGELKNGGFVIWRTNRLWNGVFYPIFKGRLLKKSDQYLLEIKTRFNPYAELIILGLGTFLIYGIISSIVLQANNDIKFLFRRSLIGILIFLILQAVPIVSYYNLKGQTLKNLEKYFSLTKEI